MAVGAPDRALTLSQLSEADIRELYPRKVGSAELQRRIWLVPPSEIMAAIQSRKINDEHYLALLSDEQLKEIKISQLSYDVFNNLAFPFGVDEGEIRRRFSLFQPEEVVKVLEGEHLTYEFPKYFSDEQIRHVRLSKLTYSQLSNLFPYRESEAKTARRFSLFLPDDLMQALKDDKLSSWRCSKFFSDEQMRALRISELSSEQISGLFSEKGDESTNRRRFALLDSDDVKKAVMDDKLSGYLLSLRSEKQK